MRSLKYELLPEAYGSNNKFVCKEGTVAELILDTGMLLISHIDKVIPSLPVLNKMLLDGYYPRAGEWEPFEITQEEYKELVEYLVSLPIARPYRTNDNV